MLFNISDNKVSFDLFGKTAEYDKIPFALYQLSEAFEIKIKEDVEQLKKNRENGQPLLITNEGYNAEGKLATSYKVIPWAWDNIDEVKGMMRNIGSFVSKTLSLYGIKLNPNWQHISAPWVTRATEISDIMNKAQGDTFQLAAQNLANTYQRAYNEELAKDYGLSFGILSSSFTAHLVYAAQATAKEMKDKERAAEVASAMTGDPMAHIVTKVFEVIYPLYMNSAEPALIKLLGEYYSYVLSLLAKELGYDFDAVISKFDMEASSKALEKHEGKEAIFAALKKNPSNGVVIGYAIENDLLDDELCDYAKEASPIFMERVVNWAITVLAKIYNEGKLFNKPLINDDNRKIVIGLMRFFKSENPNLVENENWQKVLMGAFTYEIGKHLTDLGEISICIASPLDFDARARSGKKFTLSKETKAMFVFLCNELFFSSAYTSASFLGIKTPLSIEAIDKSLNDWNKKLDERAAELAEQAEIARKKQERENKNKEKNMGIAFIVFACICIFSGIGFAVTESIFMAIVMFGISIGLFIAGPKKIASWKAYIEVEDKEIIAKKKADRQAAFQKNKNKIILYTVLGILGLAAIIILPIVISNSVELASRDKFTTQAEMLEHLEGWWLCDDENKALRITDDGKVYYGTSAEQQYTNVTFEPDKGCFEINGDEFVLKNGGIQTTITKEKYGDPYKVDISFYKKTATNGVGKTISDGTYIFRIEDDGKSLSVTDIVDSTVQRVVIPASLDGYTVVAIGDMAFDDNKTITSVVLPDTIKSIGMMAFDECSNLTSIDLGSSCTSIGGSAFSGCRRLAAITLPNTIKEINYSAFKNCTALKSITIPEGITEIQNHTFYGCSNLTKIVIPSTLKSIGDNAFTGATSSTDVYITNLASWCKIEYEDIYSHPFLWGGDLYLNNSKVKNLVVTSAITEVGKFAFYNCSSIQSVSFKGNNTKILKQAFSGCSNLTSIDFHNVAEIGAFAFGDCDSLTTCTITSSVKLISNRPFYDCKNLTNVYFEVTSGWSRSTIGYSTSSEAISVTDSEYNASTLSATYTQYFAYEWHRD